MSQGLTVSSSRLANIWGWQLSAGFHEDYGRKHEVRSGSDRAFGLVMALATLALGAWPVIKGKQPRIPLLAISACLAALALLAPRALALPNRLWTAFGLLLG